MEEANKIISVSENMNHRYLKGGILFLVAGVVGIATEIVELSTVLDMIVSTMLMIYLIIIMVVRMRDDKRQKEEFDEMADAFFYKAKAKARDEGISHLCYFLIIVLVMTLAEHFLDIHIDMSRINPALFIVYLAYIYIGANDYIVGKEFARLEAE